MKIAVIGAGAMGSLFGGLLREGGLDVTLIDVWPEHVHAIQARGLQIVGYGGDRTVSVKAATSVRNVEPVDAVFIQTKSLHTAAAVQSARPLFTDDTVAISFQNGLGNEEVIAKIVGEDRVLGGVTTQGAAIVAPGTVRNFGDLPSYIGEMAGGVSTRVRTLAAAFTAAGLPTIPSDNIRRDIFKKLLANVGISAVSALCDCTVDELFAAPEIRDMVFDALDEAIAVAAAEGVTLDVDEAHEMLLAITGPDGTPGNRSSMAVDISSGRKSEIDFVNGAIVRLGIRHGVPTPVNQTLFALTKGLERNCA